MSQLPSNEEELHSTVIDFATPLIPSLISMHEADVLYCNQIMEFVFLLYSYDDLSRRAGILQEKGRWLSGVLNWFISQPDRWQIKCVNFGNRRGEFQVECHFFFAVFYVSAGTDSRGYSIIFCKIWFGNCHYHLHWVSVLLCCKPLVSLMYGTPSEPIRKGLLCIEATSKHQIYSVFTQTL